MAKPDRSGEFGVALAAAALGGILVLLLDRMLPLESLFNVLPLYVRVVLAASICLFLAFAFSYFGKLGGADAAHGSAERAEYDDLRTRVAAGGTPALVYRRWL